METSSRNNGNRHTPPEFQSATNFVFFQSDAEQSAHAKLMNADAEHRKEETRKLKRENLWWGLGQQVLGFFVYTAFLLIGFFIGWSFG